jgi:hypothetical protein
VVFCGEVVVNCVVKRGGLMVVFRGLKFATFIKYFCGTCVATESFRGGAGWTFLRGTIVIAD